MCLPALSRLRMVPGVLDGVAELPGEQLRVLVVVTHVDQEHLLQLVVRELVVLPALGSW